MPCSIATFNLANAIKVAAEVKNVTLYDEISDLDFIAKVQVTQALLLAIHSWVNMWD